MHKLMLAAVLALPMTPAFADVTIIGENGGTITKSRDCERGDGVATCTFETGATSSKLRVRTAEPGMANNVITVTGPKGNTRTRERSVTWGD
jgi:hypothetical protein